MSVGSTWIERSFRAACEAELLALKPGNVHLHADGHGMTAQDFRLSAQVAAPCIARPGLGVGARILAATQATRAACGQNTNLGILLLAAPLAAAAESRAGLDSILAGLTVEDAALAYRAIRLAAPGGLGRSDRHDVADEPTVTLLEAMRIAADRDRIAWQYAHGFADVLRLGLPRLDGRLAAGWPESWAVTATYLAFLATFPDSHIERKHGPAVAAQVRDRAAVLDRDLLAAADPSALEGRLLAFDRELKERRINPGTSADLTVASHFARALAAGPADAICQ